MSSWLVQPTVSPTLIVTVGGINLKLAMPPSAAPAGARGGAEAGAGGPAAEPWPALLEAAGAQAASPKTAIAPSTDHRNGVMRFAGPFLPAAVRASMGVLSVLAGTLSRSPLDTEGGYAAPSTPVTPVGTSGVGPSSGSL